MGFSVFSDMVKDFDTQRRTFFDLAFGTNHGWVCISYIHTVTRAESHRFFEWPNAQEELFANINSHADAPVHAYFCPNLYDSPTVTGGKKDKSGVRKCPSVWADLDTCDPQKLHISPSVLIQSSPGKFQALWLLQDPLEPDDAQDISRNIAYAHAEDGADKSGHDLSQLLRIPYTANLKYGELGDAPIVSIIEAVRKLYRPSDFHKRYPPTIAIRQIEETPMPEDNDDETVEDILNRYNAGMHVHNLVYDDPDDGEDWSSKIHHLCQSCKELGMSMQDCFTVVKASKCNKFARDGRPDKDLWKDIKRAFTKHTEVMKLAPTGSSTIPELITNDEIKEVQKRQTFVERYIKWAEGLTDASIQYHQAGAFVILSSLLAGNLSLPTSFGTIIPNLWFMILGPTTVTRKSVAMNISMRLLNEVDDRAMMATDGSLEGILMGMRDRPKQPSIFLRDEFTGLLEAIAHKDYMAGFSEQLTKLYDGEPIKRLLRKETIDIKDPVFIMFVGGIKSKTQMMLTEELVMGGFLPRFVMISADADLSRMRPIGPPMKRDEDHREMIKNELIAIHNHYVTPTEVTQNGNMIGIAPRDFEVTLTPAAWDRYNKFEALMLQTALDTGLEYLMPVYDRLCKSTLKAAMLIAASVQHSDRVIISELDLLHAIYYARFWREFASETVNGIGKNYDERLMDKMYMEILGNGQQGVSRDTLMRKYALDAKRADNLFRTMEQRHVIKMERTDNGRSYVANV